MKTLTNLVQTIQEDPVIRRFQELERIVDQDENLRQQYKELLQVQKAMVQREHTNHPAYGDTKEQYESLLANLVEHPLMSEYLDLLEQINEDLAMVQTIIEQEVNHNLK